MNTGTLVARQLLEAGFRRMRAFSLKGKHIDVLLQSVADRLAVVTFRAD
jgi:hypothetical protein